MTKKSKVLLTMGIAVGVVTFLVYSSLGHTQQYQMVDELMAKPTVWVGKELKVHGWVEPGSIQEQVLGHEMTRTFVLEKGGKKIRVTHKGPKPDTFRDQSEVVATGTFLEKDGGYIVDAKELSAKCPSKYEGAQANKKLKVETVN